MPKAIDLRQGFGSVLLWSVISAAFIGPGTVTTAARAGAAHDFQLLWALVFSTGAAIVLQEAAARITIASGKSLGEIIALRYAKRGRYLSLALFAAVAFGCTAYEAGNILGAVAGLQLLTAAPAHWLSLLVAVPAALLLWSGRHAGIARLMGAVVFVMGFAFIWVALQTKVPAVEVLQGALVPTMPPGALLLVTGLIGTTIVPYNLFLASGIGQGQSIGQMRSGLILAVLIGGLISMAILAAGTTVAGDFSYAAVGQALARQTGQVGATLFAVGLFAAGATSTVTAPLAAAVTARSLLGSYAGWKAQNFQLVWAIVLCTGLAFGMAGVRPIPAIILAQAINGVLLPFVAAFVLLAINDRKLLPARYTNGSLANALMLLVFAIVCLLSLQNLWKTLTTVFSALQQVDELAWWIQAGISAGITAVLARRVSLL